MLHHHQRGGVNGAVGSEEPCSCRVSSVYRHHTNWDQLRPQADWQSLLLHTVNLPKSQHSSCEKAKLVVKGPVLWVWQLHKLIYCRGAARWVCSWYKNGLWPQISEGVISKSSCSNAWKLSELSTFFKMREKQSYFISQDVQLQTWVRRGSDSVCICQYAHWSIFPTEHETNEWTVRTLRRRGGVVQQQKDKI